jgi:hypothetical protein
MIISKYRSVLGNITKKTPVLHRLLVFAYHIFIFEIWPRVRSSSANDGSCSDLSDGLKSFLSLQTIRSLEIKLPTVDNDKELVRALMAANVPFIEGGWTLYLPPSDALQRIFPALREYPSNSGLKILRHIAAPLKASYTPNSLRPTPGASMMRSKTPSPQELMRIAGKFANEGLGPIIYDLIELRIGNAIGTAYITEHIDNIGGISDKDHSEFMSKLELLLEEGIISTHHGDTKFSKDFKAPDCSGNLLKAKDDRLIYVDFQSFRYQDENKAFTDWAQNNSSHILFGPRRMGKEKDYFYQMIPGIGDAKRATISRWNVIDQLLKESEIDLNDRIVFDIGCNTGLMSYYALSRGAKWAFGWDQKPVAKAAEQLLRLLGASRWNAFGSDLNEDIDFKSFLPLNTDNEKSGVLLYLAISNHIGFPPKIAELPWKYCIYEGHSHQDIACSIDKIKSSNWSDNIQILGKTTIKDNYNPTRSIIVFCR